MSGKKGHLYRFGWIALAAGWSVAGQSPGQVLMDDFSDGVAAGAGNTSGAEWFISKSASTFSVVDDSAGLGSGLALAVDVGNPASSVNVLAAGFTPVALANTGDFIRLSFDFRFDGPPSIQPAFTPQFGLFNSNGTPGPGTDVTDNDFGYSITIATTSDSGANNTSFSKEAANSASGILAGAEAFNFNGVENNEFFLTEGENYNLRLEIARLATGVELLFHADGVQVLRTFDLSGEGAFTSFDELAIRSRFSPYLIDNVLVETGNRPVSLPGDFTGDSLLTVADFNRLMSNWGNQHLGIPVVFSDGDFDLDGDIDIFDLDGFLEMYELVNGAGASAALLAPEPGALSVMALGLAGVLRRRRRGCRGRDRATGSSRSVTQGADS